MNKTELFAKKNWSLPTRELLPGLPGRRQLRRCVRLPPPVCQPQPSAPANLCVRMIRGKLLVSLLFLFVIFLFYV